MTTTTNWRVLSRLAGYTRPYLGRMAAGFVAVILTNALMMALPWLMKAAVDSFRESVTREKLAGYALAIIGLVLIEGAFRFLMRRWIIGLSRDVEYDLRNDLFAHLERLPLSFFQKNRTGDLMSRITNDLGNVRMLVGPAVMYTANTVLTAAFAIILMLRIDVPLTLLALVPLPAVSWGVRRFGRRIHDLTEESQQRLADLSARVQESLAGVRVVRAFVQEQWEASEFDRMQRRLVDKNYEAIRIVSVFYPMMQFVIGLGMLILLWFGGRQVVSQRISLGDFVAFTVYLGMLAWPMIAFGWVVNLLERGKASMERLNYILDAKPEIEDGPDVQTNAEIRGRIEIRGLSFAYNGRPVLREIDLDISEGSTLAIVGATGAGKSTLVQLIPRLYNAPPNTVFIDGLPVERIPLATLRRSIGFVPQDTFLFGETIGENIAFGRESAAPEAIRKAAAVAQVAADIDEFPKGYETVVGERGITLSGGQKQRTAIARAVLRDPRILILDDALSSVDTYTEERILHQLRGVMKSRTSILISHRVSTVKDADEIVVLDHGRIVERGTHDSLIALNGYYADLHQRQLLEDELVSSE